MHCTECPAEWDDAYELDRILDVDVDYHSHEYTAISKKEGNK